MGSCSREDQESGSLSPVLKLVIEKNESPETGTDSMRLPKGPRGRTSIV